MIDGAKKCSRCGAVFTCDIAAGKSRCWCFDLPPVSHGEKSDEDCLCPQCLTARVVEEKSSAEIRPAKSRE